MKTLKNIFIILVISTGISYEIFGQEYIYPNIPKNIHNDFILDFYLDKNLIKSFSDFDESILRLKSENGIVRYGIIQRNYLNEKPLTKRYNDLYKMGSKYVEEWIRIIPLEGYNSMFGEVGDSVIVTGVQYDSYNYYPIKGYFSFKDKRMYRYLFTIADILDKLQLKTVTDFKQSFTNKWHRSYTNGIYLENLYRDYNSRIVTNRSGDFRRRYKYNGYDIKMDWEIDNSGKKSKFLKRDLEYKNNILIYTNIVYLNYTNDKGKIKTKKVKLEKEKGIYYSELEKKYLNLYNHAFSGYFGVNPSNDDLKHNFIEIINDVDKLFISNLEQLVFIY